jgi:Amidohydrolase
MGRLRCTTGRLVKIDDPRLDPMWEACGSLNMPVAIHVSDPLAFFSPTNRFNERYEELSNHPDWSFASPEYPSNAELLEARNRVFARHPKRGLLLCMSATLLRTWRTSRRTWAGFPI